MLGRIKNVLTDKLEIPYELLNNDIKLTVYGNKRMVIERHEGIEVYREEEIKIKSGGGLLCVHGEGMKIINYGKDDIIIEGAFFEFAFEEA